MEVGDFYQTNLFAFYSSVLWKVLILAQLTYAVSVEKNQCVDVFNLGPVDCVWQWAKVVGL